MRAYGIKKIHHDDPMKNFLHLMSKRRYERLVFRFEQIRSLVMTNFSGDILMYNFVACLLTFMYCFIACGYLFTTCIRHTMLNYVRDYLE